MLLLDCRRNSKARVFVKLHWICFLVKLLFGHVCGASVKLKIVIRRSIKLECDMKTRQALRVSKTNSQTWISKSVTGDWHAKSIIRMDPAAQATFYFPCSLQQLSAPKREHKGEKRKRYAEYQPYDRARRVGNRVEESLGGTK